MSRPWRALGLALALILGGSLLAWRTHTAGGTVDVREVMWVTPSGAGMSGLLYVPDGVSADNPAPGILAVHGYINSRETQAGFAIEFARRGYVVLSIDQTGHGYSDPPAFSAGFGGPAALTYLRSLDFVDREQIGLEGHSMGGWAVGSAAAAAPDDYRSIVLAGSSTGTFGVPDGTPDWPRNIAVIFSIWDEFSPTMWQTPRASDIGKTEKLQALFATDQEVVPETLYGSIADGTGRMLFQPRTNHPGDHLSSEAIGQAVGWFQATLAGGNQLPPDDQIWIWKEIGSLVAAIGMVLLLFPLGALLLGTAFFSDLRRVAVSPTPVSRLGWWIAAGVTALLGPLTFFTLKDLPGTLEWAPSPLFPQSITNSVIAWTTVLGLVTLLMLGAGRLAARRREARTVAPSGEVAAVPPRAAAGGLLILGKSALLSLLIVATAYSTLAVVDFLFLTDFRFWVFAIKPMSALHLRIALGYFLPFAFYFCLLSLVVRSQLDRPEWTLRRQLVVNLALLTIGYVGLYLLQYVPLLTGGVMALPDESLWTIISYQLLPLMLIVGAVLTWFGRNTRSAWTGGLLSAALITWIVVASQATHVAL